jgi:hypothetical protein
MGSAAGTFRQVIGELLSYAQKAIANRLWRQSSTFRRLLTSQHVWDLQAIFVVTLFTALGLLIWYIFAPSGRLDEKFVGAVLLISGTILSWTYQNGSKRLGVVDLFACEIVTLCRVGTIAQLATRLINAHQKLSEGMTTPGQLAESPWQQVDFGRFSSQEDYFTVFEHNTKDLQVLEADVVINVTAFYTYMKSLRDQLRRLGDLGSGDEVKIQKAAVLVTSIYMTFLAYESARQAIGELVEFEPTRAEASVTGLITELQVYRFLRDFFPKDDIRSRRLVLREPKYGLLVPQLYKEVMNAKGPEWENAQATAVDLKAVYNLLKFDPPIGPVYEPLADSSAPRLSPVSVAAE